MTTAEIKKMLKTIENLRWQLCGREGTGQPGTWQTALDEKLVDAQRALEN